MPEGSQLRQTEQLQIAQKKKQCQQRCHSAVHRWTKLSLCQGGGSGAPLAVWLKSRLFYRRRDMALSRTVKIAFLLPMSINDKVLSSKSVANYLFCFLFD